MRKGEEYGVNPKQHGPEVAPSLEMQRVEILIEWIHEEDYLDDGAKSILEKTIREIWEVAK